MMLLLQNDTILQENGRTLSNHDSTRVSKKIVSSWRVLENDTVWGTFLKTCVFGTVRAVPPQTVPKTQVFLQSGPNDPKIAGTVLTK